MTSIQLTTGEPVPEDGSHKEIDPSTGQQKGYVVLSPEERAKGFVKPVRRSYIHEKCGGLTTMGTSLAETYARNPYFYSGTFCCGCGAHFPMDQFHWEDGEPMEPSKQAEWAKSFEIEMQRRHQERQERIEREERAQLARLKAKYETDSSAPSAPPEQP